MDERYNLQTIPESKEGLMWILEEVIRGCEYLLRRKELPSPFHPLPALKDTW